MNKLKEYRLRRKLSQYTLADKIGCSRSYVSEVEKGNRKMTLKFARRIGEILNVDPFELLGTDAIKYTGDFEQTLRALVNSNFDLVVEHTVSKTLPDKTWYIYWIVFDILNTKFTTADLAEVKSVVGSLKRKYEVRR